MFGGGKKAEAGKPLRNAFLVGEKVYLRAAEPADAETCYEWFSDPETREHLGRRAYPNTIEQSRKVIESCDWKTRQMFSIVERASGDHVGNCDLFAIDPFNRSAELGIAIGRKDLWGKGFGRETCRLLCRHGFRTLNLHRIYLRVYASNDRALRCYKGAGFKGEGRLREDAYVDGRYVDTLLMGMLRGEFMDPQHQPQLEKA